MAKDKEPSPEDGEISGADDDDEGSKLDMPMLTEEDKETLLSVKKGNGEKRARLLAEDVMWAETCSNPPSGYVPAMKAWFDVGFGLPIHPFIHELLTFYKLELSHLSPNFFAQLRTFIWLCETAVKGKPARPTISLFGYFFQPQIMAPERGKHVLGSVSLSFLHETEYPVQAQRDDWGEISSKWFYLRTGSDFIYTGKSAAVALATKQDTVPPLTSQDKELINAIKEMRYRKSVRHLMEEMTILRMSTLVERERAGFHSGLKPPKLTLEDLLTVEASRTEAELILGPRLESEKETCRKILDKNRGRSAVAAAFDFSFPHRSDSTSAQAHTKDHSSRSSKQDQATMKRKNPPLPGSNYKERNTKDPVHGSEVVGTQISSLPGSNSKKKKRESGGDNRLSDYQSNIVVAPKHMPLEIGSLGTDLRSIGSSSAQAGDLNGPNYKIRDKANLFFNLDPRAGKIDAGGKPCVSRSQPLANAPTKPARVEDLGYPMWPYLSSSDPNALVPSAISLDENPENISVCLAAVASLSSQTAAVVQKLFDEVPGLVRRLNTQASEMREQLEAQKAARLNSEAALARTLMEKKELQAILDESLLKNKMLEEEKAAVCERAISQSRGLARAVRTSMELAGADMMDPEPEYSSSEEWVDLANQRLKALQDINDASNRSFAVTAVMASAATVSSHLGDTDLAVGISGLDSGCSQIAFQAACDRQYTLRPAAEKFVDSLAKAIDAKNQSSGGSC